MVMSRRKRLVWNVTRMGRKGMFVGYWMESQEAKSTRETEM
jgi:hypothetical protein